MNLSKGSVIHERTSSLPMLRVGQGRPLFHSDSAEGSADKAQTPTLRLILNLLSAIACSALAVVTWQSGNWPLTVLCWLIGGHFMHTFALSFHDAAHGTLHPNQTANEWLGYLYGMMILLPMSVYRRAHARHHAYLGSIDDPELYPFVIPGTSRALRLTCAMAEIVLGYIYAPLLFARCIVLDPSLPADLRRKILLDYAVIATVGASILIVVELAGAWQIYLVGVLAPALLGGTYQTLRKYTEHLGLPGPTILQLTRTILPRDEWNKAVSTLMQHVDHHGTHHIHARIPYFKLPEASEMVYRGKIEELPVYDCYLTAFLAMLKTLADPKTGAQWHTASESGAPSPGTDKCQPHSRNGSFGTNHGRTC